MSLVLQVHDILYFFPQEKPNEITFIWASEKSGFRHLYLVTSQLSSPSRTGNDNAALDMMEQHIGGCSLVLSWPHSLSQESICFQNFEVLDSKSSPGTVGNPVTIIMCMHFIALKDLSKSAFLLSCSKDEEYSFLQRTL